MLATASNSDVVLIQLMKDYVHLDNPLQAQLDKLSEKIKHIVIAQKKVKPQLDALLPDIFNLRIKAMRWLLQDGNVDVLGMLEEVYPQIEALQVNIELEVLAENVLFALRCNRKIAKAILGNTASLESTAASLSQLPEISYEQFLASFAQIPDEIAQKLLDFVHTLLYIEFAVTALYSIHEEKWKTHAKVINELAFLVADAAQDYVAIAMELGIIGRKATPDFSAPQAFESNFLEEQKRLADQGLADFAANIADG